MSPGPMPMLLVMTSSGTSDIQSSIRRATFRSLWNSSSMYPSRLSGSTRRSSQRVSMNADMRSASPFLGYRPMTSGAIAAARSIRMSSVPSSIFSTACLSMEADTGSMHRSETLLPNGSTSTRSPSLRTIPSLSRKSTVDSTTDSTPNIWDVAP